MLETAVGDGANQLRLQEEVAETGGVDADVGTLLIDAVTSRSLGLLAVGRGGGLLSLELLVRVVDEILLGRHGDCRRVAVVRESQKCARPGWSRRQVNRRRNAIQERKRRRRKGFVDAQVADKGPAWLVGCGVEEEG